MYYKQEKWISVSKNLSKSKFRPKSQNTPMRMKDSMGGQKQDTCYYPQPSGGADGTWIHCKYTGKELWIWHQRMFNISNPNEVDQWNKPILPVGHVKQSRNQGGADSP